MHRPSCLIAVLSLTACGSQADTNYPGESQMRIAGTVINELAFSPDAEVVIFWDAEIPDSEGHDQVVWATQRIEVGSTFPSNFVLDLYEPPPRVVFAADPTREIQWANGTIWAVTPGTTADEIANDVGILGVGGDYIVSYLSQDIPPEYAAEIEAEFGFSTAGYHLRGVVPNDPNEDPYYGHSDKLVPANDDSEITVRIAPPEDLHIPSWE